MENILCFGEGRFPTSFANINDHILQLLPRTLQEMAYFLVPSSNNKTQHPTTCVPEPRELRPCSEKATAKSLLFISKLKHWTGAQLNVLSYRESGQCKYKMFSVEQNAFMCNSVVK
jgi:hypothetical protein